MTAFGRADEDAVEEMVFRFGPEVIDLGLRTLRDPEEAAAHVERTFLRIWQRALHYPSCPAPLDTWVSWQALLVAAQMTVGIGARSAAPAATSTR